MSYIYSGLLSLVLKKCFKDQSHWEVASKLVENGWISFEFVHALTKFLNFSWWKQCWPLELWPTALPLRSGQPLGVWHQTGQWSTPD